MSDLGGEAPCFAHLFPIDDVDGLVDVVDVLRPDLTTHATARAAGAATADDVREPERPPTAPCS